MPAGLEKSSVLSSICSTVNIVKSVLFLKIVSTYTSCYSGVFCSGICCVVQPYQICSEALTFVSVQSRARSVPTIGFTAQKVPNFKCLLTLTHTGFLQFKIFHGNRCAGDCSLRMRLLLIRRIKSR